MRFCSVGVCIEEWNYLLVIAQVEEAAFCETMHATHAEPGALSLKLGFCIAE